MSNPLPLTDSKRLPWIDSARGFAILGIFLVNLASFHGPYFLYGNGQNYWGLGDPGIIQMLLDIFFQASFYSLFSFLFGFGMYMIYDNLSAKQVESPRKWMVRRLIILLIIGAIHAFVIWYGDILITYALVGLLLLLFLTRKNITLWVWFACLLVIPVLMLTGLLFLTSLVADTSSLANTAAINQALQHYGEGSITAIWQQNATDWFYSNNVLNFFMITCNLLPIFLLGVLFGRNRWLHDITAHRKILQRWWVGSLFVFAVCKAGPYLIGNPFWLQMVQDTLGGTGSAIFYLLTITLWYNKAVKLFRWLGYVGKMALSNYLLQSVLGVLLFYSYGLGLYDTLTPFQTILVGLIIYPIQVLVSFWWLRYYQRGPIEWLWRSLIYQKKLSNKRAL
ncbi:DUF418 domain-containing protein [Gracilibacillus timonensis]|uniref:DUF418 domain-containing protein n=1 Tax=Gracilibacillus timonensis TaxID=1816696 RepID=UPI0008270738|nr:DUF418 domain-containing protein [Gracilibacillus timonensis]